ncbi:MAG: hypothetical protein HN348_03960 [Proteobacteria bacterium]|jgi:hypothetical protein|nr:hypothetical protein [Pseudomonadota bacterium]
MDMAFPLTIADRTIETGPQLLELIIEDTGAGGGTVVKGETPPTWIVKAQEQGSLTTVEMRGLAAALIQRGLPASVSVGARLAMVLGDAELGPLLLHALAGHDVGLLLALDPLDQERSIEDTLLRASAEVVDASDPDLREQLLTGLRNASLPEVEVDILLRFGDTEQIRRWLPAIFTEALDVPSVAPFQEASNRSPEIAKAIDDALDALPPEIRQRVDEQLGHSR